MAQMMVILFSIEYSFDTESQHRVFAGHPARAASCRHMRSLSGPIAIMSVEIASFAPIDHVNPLPGERSDQIQGCGSVRKT